MEKYTKDTGRRGAIKRIVSGGMLAAGMPCLSAPLFSDLEENGGKNFTFLFQGDSITDGNRSRNNDWSHVMGHGYAYLIASRLWYDHPGKGFHFFNRGVSGNKVQDLSARWQEDTLAIKPDLLSILVGVNDVNTLFDVNATGVVSANVFEKEYRDLLSRTKKQLPDTRVVLCEPFLLPVGKVEEKWQAWSAEMSIRQEIVSRLAREFGAIYVPLQALFDAACRKAAPDYWIWDGIHPMPAGHELMARQWIHIVEKELHFIR